MTVKKIALLAPECDVSPFARRSIEAALARQQIESVFFTESDDIDAFAPDCVLTLSPQELKLTHFPTYGILDRPVAEYTGLPRFMRNLLTLDGYLTLSPVCEQMIRDMMFGARKLDTTVTRFAFTPEVMYPVSPALSCPVPVLYQPDIAASPFKKTVTLLKKQHGNLVLCAAKWGLSRALRVVRSREELLELYAAKGVGLCLDAGCDENQLISPRIFEVIASGALVITAESATLRAVFGDSLLYFSPALSRREVCAAISTHLQWVRQHPEEAKAKVRAAQAVLAGKFAFSAMIENLQQLHAKTLIAKGFLPDPAEQKTALPSVTYILRTGGKNREMLEKTLVSLVNQQYPDLRVLMVIHKRFDYCDELVERFSSLQIKVLPAFNSIRSQALRDGMAAVETDLFGFIDDDDQIHPNHVRTLVKTLKYHDRRDWRGEISLAYSGSIMTDQNRVYEYEPEFLDAKLINYGKKRAMEHFRFYHPARMANHSWFMMSNAWLAKRSLLDEEILTDPGIDTCEDLYFELQFAQRTHFAFSVEATVFHYFHKQNSTVVDRDQHLPDTRRIALRTAFRSFAGESQYDSPYNPLGRWADPLKLPAYADAQAPVTPHSLYHAESRAWPAVPPQFCSAFAVQVGELHSSGEGAATDHAPENKTGNSLTGGSVLPEAVRKQRSVISRALYLLKSARAFMLIRPEARRVMIYKFRLYCRTYGYLAALKKVMVYSFNFSPAGKGK